MIDQLIGIIGREAAVFESFLDLLEQQKRMLVANDLSGLQAVTEKQREKLVESRTLNLKREQLVARIKETNGLDGDVTVTRLLAVLDEDRATQLRSLRETIQSLTTKITETRNSNALLMNNSREFISRVMTMLAQIQAPDTGYGPVGVAPDRPPAVAVDRRA
jgi:flagellar biosynthesis/type III secretory pathway chaperone